MLVRLVLAAGCLVGASACSPVPDAVGGSGLASGMAEGGSSTGDESTAANDSEGSDASPCTEVFEGNLVIGNGLDLASFARVREVTGSLVIARADPPLHDLAALGCLERVGDTVYVAGTAGLFDLTGLHRLSFIGGWLYVWDNVDLRSLDGLTSLRYVTGIEISGNLALEELGLHDLQGAQWLSVGTPCLDGYVLGNPLLTVVDGLDSLLAIHGIGLYGNPELIALDGLYELAERGVPVWSLSATFNERLQPWLVEHTGEALGIEAHTCGNFAQDPLVCECPISLGE